LDERHAVPSDRQRRSQSAFHPSGEIDSRENAFMRAIFRIMGLSR
jgi:hypothetical protein